MKQEIYEFSMRVEIVIRSIATQYKQLHDLRPTAELAECVNRIRNGVTSITLLEPLSIVFEVHPVGAW